MGVYRDFERINDNLFENDKQKLTFVKWARK